MPNQNVGGVIVFLSLAASFIKKIISLYEAREKWRMLSQ
jgi:hypothetical protein